MHSNIPAFEFGNKLLVGNDREFTLKYVYLFVPIRPISKDVISYYMNYSTKCITAHSYISLSMPIPSPDAHKFVTKTLYNQVIDSAYVNYTRRSS